MEFVFIYLSPMYFRVIVCGKTLRLLTPKQGEKHLLHSHQEFPIQYSLDLEEEVQLDVDLLITPHNLKAWPYIKQGSDKTKDFLKSYATKQK